MPARPSGPPRHPVAPCLRPWVGVNDYRAAMGEINNAVLEIFRSRGTVLPFPQREVRLIGDAQSISKTL